MLFTSTNDNNDQPLCWCELKGKVIGGKKGKRCELPSANDNLGNLSDPEEKVFWAVFIPAITGDIKGDYRVIFKGDLVEDKDGNSVDANHLAPWLPDRRSGDGVEGGTFESWFTI